MGETDRKNYIYDVDQRFKKEIYDEKSFRNLFEEILKDLDEKKLSDKDVAELLDDIFVGLDEKFKEVYYNLVNESRYNINTNYMENINAYKKSLENEKNSDIKEEKETEKIRVGSLGTIRDVYKKRKEEIIEKREEKKAQRELEKLSLEDDGPVIKKYRDNLDKLKNAREKLSNEKNLLIEYVEKVKNASKEELDIIKAEINNPDNNYSTKFIDKVKILLDAKEEILGKSNLEYNKLLELIENKKKLLGEESKLDDLKNKIQELEEKIVKYTEEKNVLTQELSALKDELVNSALKTVDTIGENEPALINSINEKEQKLNEINEKLKQLENEKLELNEKLPTNEIDKEALQNEIDNLEKQKSLYEQFEKYINDPKSPISKEDFYNIINRSELSPELKQELVTHKLKYDNSVFAVPSEELNETNEENIEKGNSNILVGYDEQISQLNDSIESITNDIELYENIIRRIIMLNQRKENFLKDPLVMYINEKTPLLPEDLKSEIIYFLVKYVVSSKSLISRENVVGIENFPDLKSELNAVFMNDSIHGVQYGDERLHELDMSSNIGLTSEVNINAPVYNKYKKELEEKKLEKSNLESLKTEYDNLVDEINNTNSFDELETKKEKIDNFSEEPSYFKEGLNAAYDNKMKELKDLEIEVPKEEDKSYDELTKQVIAAYDKDISLVEGKISDLEKYIELYDKIKGKILDLDKKLKEGLDKNSEEFKKIVEEINEEKAELPEDLNQELTSLLNKVITPKKKKISGIIKNKDLWKKVLTGIGGFAVGTVVGYLVTNPITLSAVGLGLMAGKLATKIGKKFNKKKQAEIIGMEEPSQELKDKLEKLKKTEKFLDYTSIALTSATAGLFAGNLLKGLTTPKMSDAPTTGTSEPTLSDSNTHDLKIGDKIGTDYDISHGYDQANWAANGTNVENLNPNYVNADSVVQRIAVVDGNGMQQFTGNTSVSELLEQGYKMEDIVIGLGKNGTDQAWIGLDEMTRGGISR